MNYRHAYHAGNICDVVKHSVLTVLLRHLIAKDKPFAVLDTHAGIGTYDLEDIPAQKTGEAQEGVVKLLAAPLLPELGAYYDILQKMNPGGGMRYYPGSPAIVRAIMRAEDRLIACELHPDDGKTLQRNFHGDKRVHIHARDGYEALGAFLPPAEKRGLVLIDPPFEQPDEFTCLAAETIAAHRRWPQGMFMIWYPVKERPAVWAFHEALAAAAIPETLGAEFIYQEETRADRLNGCGLILINPPWQLDKKLRALFPALHEALGTPHRGTAIKWLS